MTEVTWPAERNFPFADTAGLDALEIAWAYSSDQIAYIAAAISECHPIPEVACVAISGSLSRMEAHPESDIDVLVVVDDCEKVICDQAAGEAYARIWNRLAAGTTAGLKRPKSGGVFSTVARMSQLTNLKVRGIVDEDVIPYGQRMQLLLDAQPVYQSDRFEDLQWRLIKWYTEQRIERLFNEAGPFHWLWQDVQRYWRSIRARACWLHADDPRKSLEVNVKLRSSRLAIIAAMLSAIENSHRAETFEAATETLKEELCYTPLERLAGAIKPQQNTAKLLTAYQAIWMHTSEFKPDAIAPNETVLKAIKEFQTSLLPIAGDQSDWVF